MREIQARTSSGIGESLSTFDPSARYGQDTELGYFQGQETKDLRVVFAAAEEMLLDDFGGDDELAVGLMSADDSDDNKPELEMIAGMRLDQVEMQSKHDSQNLMLAPCDSARMPSYPPSLQDKERGIAKLAV